MSDNDERCRARRDEERRYEMDVCYEVWRSGGNMDAVNMDRVQTGYQNGADIDISARIELNAQCPRQHELSEEDQYEQMQQREDQE